MAINLENDLVFALEKAGIGVNINMTAMHLHEIESESETVLELLTALRSHAFREDRDATQETLAELTISLEHLLHHIQQSLPELQAGLDLKPD